MTNITELAQSLKAAADREMICRDVAETSEIWERTVTPENILALVEALEKAQQYAKERDEENQDLMLTIGRFRVEREGLEAIRAAAEKLVRCKGRYHSEKNYRALAALFGVNTPDLPPLEHENVHYADAAEMEIAALRQSIADLESRTITFKLPFTPEPSAFAPWAAKAFYQFHKDTVKSCVAVFSDACAAAGIKVEAE
ncbi:ead/Ea22-like family protein [Klebsiella pneumoniae]|uniref:ead/Ea22-like family protein n=1 Tax=Klebsiella pneumoniae TaxID=573 RepID=UPI002844F8A8|nr:ead/Ea22-like family protein [Klebsiella pneumoniae]MDR4566967.1 ead/Ea22-like family protein [Klebsiella pneumoniae]MDR4615123.1 ead/Ea22-like family protein [Klebsiella pneumoniae]MDR4715972.1 ead/Ea22-like family protein [Klebsiella pneumoniae]